MERLTAVEKKMQKEIFKKHHIKPETKVKRAAESDLKINTLNCNDQIHYT